MSHSRGEFPVIRAGDKLGNYEVVSQLGRGNFSTVYRCVDCRVPNDQQQYLALKIVKKEYSKDASYEEAMLRSIQKQDPEFTCNVPRMLECFKWDEYPIFVMTLHGNELRKCIRESGQCGFSRAEVVTLAYDLVKTMEFIHSRCRMVHTDLKPENVICKNPDTSRNFSNKEWVICDFGSASFCRMENLDSDLISTRPYRAPEVVLGNAWHYAADMWSLGCIIYEVMVGHQLFDVHDELTHLSKMQRTLGTIPSFLVYDSKYSRKFFDHHGVLRTPPPESNGSGRSKGTRATSAGRASPLNARNGTGIHGTTGTLKKRFQDDREMYDLIAGLLEYNPDKRLTAKDALALPIFAKGGSAARSLRSGSGNRSSKSASPKNRTRAASSKVVRGSPRIDVANGYTGIPSPQGMNSIASSGGNCGHRVQSVDPCYRATGKPAMPEMKAENTSTGTIHQQSPLNRSGTDRRANSAIGRRPRLKADDSSANIGSPTGFYSLSNTVNSSTTGSNSRSASNLGTGRITRSVSGKAGQQRSDAKPAQARVGSARATVLSKNRVRCSSAKTGKAKVVADELDNSLKKGSGKIREKQIDGELGASTTLAQDQATTADKKMISTPPAPHLQYPIPPALPAEQDAPAETANIVANEAAKNRVTKNSPTPYTIRGRPSTARSSITLSHTVVQIDQKPETRISESEDHLKEEEQGNTFFGGVRNMLSRTTSAVSEKFLPSIRRSKPVPQLTEVGQNAEQAESKDTTSYPPTAPQSSTVPPLSHSNSISSPKLSSPYSIPTTGLKSQAVLKRTPSQLRRESYGSRPSSGSLVASSVFPSDILPKKTLSRQTSFLNITREAKLKESSPDDRESRQNSEAMSGNAPPGTEEQQFPKSRVNSLPSAESFCYVAANAPLTALGQVKAQDIVDSRNTEYQLRTEVGKTVQAIQAAAPDAAEKEKTKEEEGPHPETERQEAHATTPPQLSAAQQDGLRHDFTAHVPSTPVGVIRARRVSLHPDQHNKIRKSLTSPLRGVRSSKVGNSSTHDIDLFAAPLPSQSEKEATQVTTPTSPSSPYTPFPTIEPCDANQVHEVIQPQEPEVPVSVQFSVLETVDVKVVDVGSSDGAQLVSKSPECKRNNATPITILPPRKQRSVTPVLSTSKGPSSSVSLISNIGRTSSSNMWDQLRQMGKCSAERPNEPHNNNNNNEGAAIRTTSPSTRISVKLEPGKGDEAPVMRKQKTAPVVAPSAKMKLHKQRSKSPPAQRPAAYNTPRTAQSSQALRASVRSGVAGSNGSLLSPRKEDRGPRLIRKSLSNPITNAAANTSREGSTLMKSGSRSSVVLSPGKASAAARPKSPDTAAKSSLSMIPQSPRGQQQKGASTPVSKAHRKLFSTLKASADRVTPTATLTDATGVPAQRKFTMKTSALSKSMSSNDDHGSISHVSGKKTSRVTSQGTQSSHDSSFTNATTVTRFTTAIAHDGVQKEGKRPTVDAVSSDSDAFTGKNTASAASTMTQSGMFSASQQHQQQHSFSATEQTDSSAGSPLMIRTQSGQTGDSHYTQTISENSIARSSCSTTAVLNAANGTETPTPISPLLSGSGAHPPPAANTTQISTRPMSSVQMVQAGTASLQPPVKAVKVIQAPRPTYGSPITAVKTSGVKRGSVEKRPHRSDRPGTGNEIAANAHKKNSPLDAPDAASDVRSNGSPQSVTLQIPALHSVSLKVENEYGEDGDMSEQLNSRGCSTFAVAGKTYYSSNASATVSPPTMSLSESTSQSCHTSSCPQSSRGIPNVNGTGLTSPVAAYLAMNNALDAKQLHRLGSNTVIPTGGFNDSMNFINTSSQPFKLSADENFNV